MCLFEYRPVHTLNPHRKQTFSTGMKVKKFNLTGIYTMWKSHLKNIYNVKRNCIRQIFIFGCTVNNAITTSCSKQITTNCWLISCHWLGTHSVMCCNSPNSMGIKNILIKILEILCLYRVFYQLYDRLFWMLALRILDS